MALLKYYNSKIHDLYLYDGRHTWTTAAREVGERVLGGGRQSEELFLLARGRGGGGGCFFWCCAHMGVPRSWHPIFFGSFALRAFGSPAITAPNILLARACGGG